MNNTYVVLGTKGGTGKSMVAGMVVPVLFANSDVKVTVYTVDDNNTIELKSDCIEFNDGKTKDANKVIDDVEFKRICNKNEVSIIDAGGGEDTRILIDSIKKSNVKNLTYIIPLGDDYEQKFNLIDTIDLINSISDNKRIFLLLNKVNVFDKDKVEEQFVGVFGSKKYDIDKIDDKVFESIDGVFYLENTPIFTILKNVYHTTLLDSYVGASELLHNLEVKKQEWAKKGPEYFHEQNAKVRFASEVIMLTERIYTMKKMVWEHDDGK